jgi:hypothetical protein
MPLGLNPPFSTVYREVRHDAELDGRNATIGSRVLVSLFDANSDVCSEPLEISFFYDPRLGQRVRRASKLVQPRFSTSVVQYLWSWSHAP